MTPHRGIRILSPATSTTSLVLLFKRKGRSPKESQKVSSGLGASPALKPVGQRVGACAVALGLDRTVTRAILQAFDWGRPFSPFKALPNPLLANI